MAVQLPPEVLGVAVVVLLYSFICLFSGFFLLWLVCTRSARAVSNMFSVGLTAGG
jgi:hypothetical protein